jgi:hypothetical protein
MVRFACPVPHRTHAHWSSIDSCGRCQSLFPQAVGRGAIGGPRTIGLSRPRPAGETGTYGHERSPVVLISAVTLSPRLLCALSRHGTRGRSAGDLKNACGVTRLRMSAPVNGAGTPLSRRSPFACAPGRQGATSRGEEGANIRSWSLTAISSNTGCAASAAGPTLVTSDGPSRAGSQRRRAGGARRVLASGTPSSASRLSS